MGHSDLLEFEEPGSADFRSSLDAIKRGAGAQLRLVNDLLDISSIASGIISLELRRLDLNEVLQRAVASLRQAHGTTFLVFFPLLEIQTADTDGANSFEWEKTRQVPRGSLKGLSFLLIEDEDDARQLFATSLRMAGAHVEAVEDTRQGFHWIQKQGFDAVIGDISLPGEDGYALMRRIRAYETTHRKPPVKAIALTAHAHAADKGRALEAGYDSHIAKPASPYFIVESIIQTLHKA